MTTLDELELEYKRLLAEGRTEQADRLGPMIDYLGRLEDAEPSIVSQAIELATGRGFAVFPAIGKQPDGHWPSISTTNAERIVSMWAGKGDRNIGISCKRSGLLVVDEDRLGGFVEAAASVGVEPPETYSVMTGKGRHWYFRAPEDCRLGNSPGKFAAFGCDIRGPGEANAYGGYVIAAGSRHPDGSVYTELDSAADVAELPSWVVELILDERRAEPVDAMIVAPGSRSTFALPAVIAGPRSGSGGARHQTIVAYSASLRAQEVSIENARVLVEAAWRRCEQPPDVLTPFPLLDAERILEDIYRRFPPGPSTGSRRASQIAAERSETAGRRIRTTLASALTPRRVRWLWTGRLAVGTLSLLAGPEGLGKSTLAYWIAARLTRGELDGEYLGQPRAVLVCATEDAWEEVVLLRLIAADADLDLVVRVDAINRDDIVEGLELPTDNEAVADAAAEHHAALLLLDPLISRLAAGLDSHKDAEVRKALEPLVAMLAATGLAALGLIHLNKSGMSGILDRVMASKAFTAVARSVHVVLPDPDDQTGARRLFGTAKSNLGKTNLATLGFTIEPFEIPVEDGVAETGRVKFGEDGVEQIGDVMSRAADDDRIGVDTREAIEWLSDYFEREPRAASRDVKRDASRAGIPPQALGRARKRLGLQFWSEGFPRETVWATRDYKRPGRLARETTGTTDTTGTTGND